KGEKPVVYLFSPHGVDASVRLTLTREWDLSVLYPVVPAKRVASGGQTIEWAVHTHLAAASRNATPASMSRIYSGKRSQTPGSPSQPRAPLSSASLHPHCSRRPLAISPPRTRRQQDHAIPRRRASCDGTAYRGAHAVHSARSHSFVLAPRLAEAPTGRTARRSSGRVRSGCAPGHHALAGRGYPRVHGLQGCCCRKLRRVECGRGEPRAWTSNARSIQLCFRVLEWGGME
ncbi:hypothetical protein C8R44DRAFT_923341, partial [Mycena epipterygia]